MPAASTDSLFLFPRLGLRVRQLTVVSVIWWVALWFFLNLCCCCCCWIVGLGTGSDVTPTYVVTICSDIVTDAMLGLELLQHCAEIKWVSAEFVPFRIWQEPVRLFLFKQFDHHSFYTLTNYSWRLHVLLVLFQSMNECRWMMSVSVCGSFHVARWFWDLWLHYYSDYLIAKEVLPSIHFVGICLWPIHSLIWRM